MSIEETYVLEAEEMLDTVHGLQQQNHRLTCLLSRVIEVVEELPPGSLTPAKHCDPLRKLRGIYLSKIINEQSTVLTSRKSLSQTPQLSGGACPGRVPVGQEESQEAGVQEEVGAQEGGSTAAEEPEARGVSARDGEAA